MRKEPDKIGARKSINDVTFRIVDKGDKIKAEVMELLHQYPDHFVHGLVEEYVEQDFAESDIVIAYDKGVPIGCLMFNRVSNEFNWLAVSRDAKARRSEIAKRLFESFYPTIEVGVEVHFFVNTEDASITGHPSFSGKNFEPARNLYRSMGLEIKNENRVENKYGPGGHAYRVAWVPRKKD
ncbi:hypothetical protein A3D62_01525 [Candidatus Kaiserbacteria bacterium RIFCSPHIGHO2_02_FULL_49_11]|uniref:N-acetyltransferase domain-containing protein n=1 Tax=Candidatus Kaiserbacteria bacterium RIFCSPHIGHO2_02_FULL_49_11 TaxID=1798489 RepID=A0A1F6D1I9_9BACT|nr:MAG: hypothetical protein A3D62_01525 [Candidatus Kaiserbacteria bacterium RIFCSPHIGHO2_02_FULL_49_11]